MSDIYVPGVRSRFNSDKLIDDLMSVERIPRDRAQTNIDSLQIQKGYWQEVGRRINSLRDSARHLFSFQNPFNERIADSSDSTVLTATTTREAQEQSLQFTVKQTALADRFLSQPLDERMRIEAGTYSFSVGKNDISISFRGGTLRDFVEIINRRGQDKLGASLISVQTGTRSLLIEAKQTGIENRLTFSNDALDFALNIGMMQRANDTQRDITINTDNIRKSGQNASNISVQDGVVKVSPQSTASLPLNLAVEANTSLVLRLETQTRVEIGDAFFTPQPPTGPVVPSGNVTYGGITIENEPSHAPTPEWQPPIAPVRNDDMSVLTINFQDGSSRKLPAITDSNNFTARQYPLSEIAQGKTITSINIENNNTHREVSVGKIDVIDPSIAGGLKPLNAVSSARDAIISMEGIEIKRTTNNIDDLIPGVTLNLKGVSDRPVNLNIRGNTESVKDAIIAFVGNYNRLIAEINILTSTRGNVSAPDMTSQSRGDSRLIDELTYLSREEADEMRRRLGAFGGDVTLNTLKNNLMRTVSAPYPTHMERDLSLLAQIGISTNADRNTGYDASRLRGYLQINEQTLDGALENRIPAIRELFASDTTGDMLADTGVAFNVDALVRPFVETGGIVTLKTNTIDSRINQDERRISTLDRQLAAKEQELRIQFARMESAYARMESMSTSLDNFNQQNRGNR
ncbi:MAG: flagellar filament capping protein FliD [Treponema sp.]|nr:flagellar filament capping protein FliD [Treponema sp.]MCL2251200.1 flagellar filament capping protein FliD [Treponema sp.]